MSSSSLYSEVSFRNEAKDQSQGALNMRRKCHRVIERLLNCIYSSCVTSVHLMREIAGIDAISSQIQLFTGPLLHDTGGKLFTSKFVKSRLNAAATHAFTPAESSYSSLWDLLDQSTAIARSSNFFSLLSCLPRNCARSGHHR